MRRLKLLSMAIAGWAVGAQATAAPIALHCTGSERTTERRQSSVYDPQTQGRKQVWTNVPTSVATSFHLTVDYESGAVTHERLDIRSPLITDDEIRGDARQKKVVGLFIVVGTGDLPDGRFVINRKTGAFQAAGSRGTCEKVDVTTNRF